MPLIKKLLGDAALHFTHHDFKAMHLRHLGIHVNAVYYVFKRRVHLLRQGIYPQIMPVRKQRDDNDPGSGVSNYPP